MSSSSSQKRNKSKFVEANVKSETPASKDASSSLHRLPFDQQPNLNLYEVFGISKKEALGEPELKKAYYKATLKYHPDKLPLDSSQQDKDFATSNFQFLGRAYKILSTPSLKSAYDQSGRLPDDWDAALSSTQEDWTAYFRDLFNAVSLSVLDQLQSSYQGSPEERTDVLNLYNQHNGHVGRIIDGLYFCNVETDYERIIKIITDAISTKELSSTPLFLKTKTLSQNRQRKAAKESREASQLASELGLSKSLDKKENLLSCINSTKKRLSSDDFIKALENKYCKKSSYSKKPQ